MISDKQIKLVMLLTCISIVCISGCKIQSADPQNGYYSDYAMSAVEYSIFISKQVSVVENVLSTRMSMASSVGSGDYSVPAEMDNTQEAISKVIAVRDELSVTRPAVGMETDMKNILSLVNDSIDVLQDYHDALNNKDKDEIKKTVTELKNCFIALSGEANTYYQ